MAQWHDDRRPGWKWHRHSSAPIDKWSAAWGPAWINTRLQSHDVFFLQISQSSSSTSSSRSKICPFENRVGHADASADAHRMRINAHRCASSAYCAKNDIPFFTYKLPFWLRFSKSLGPEPHQLTNISYVESGEVLSFCVNEAREYLYRYLFQGGQTHYVENILLF